MKHARLDRHMLARLAAAERRIKHLETYVTSLELGVGGLRPPGEEPPFVRRLRELDEQDQQEQVTFDARDQQERPQ
jgi:hypothetical protein